MKRWKSKEHNLNREKGRMTGDCMLVDYWSRLRKNTDGGMEVKMTETENEKPSYWQLVFMQSKVNGAAYNGEALPGRNWDWPKDTYLQRRLHRAKFFQAPDGCKLN